MLLKVIIIFFTKNNGVFTGWLSIRYKLHLIWRNPIDNNKTGQNCIEPEYRLLFYHSN